MVATSKPSETEEKNTTQDQPAGPGGAHPDLLADENALDKKNEFVGGAHQDLLA
jgi:hypothetical protein